MIVIYWLFRNASPKRMDVYFRKLQLVSAAIFSFAHGTNDAQKTMGIITGVLFTTEYDSDSRCSDLGDLCRACGHWTWNAQRRLADRQDDGRTADALKAARRICGRNRGGHLDPVLQRTGNAGSTTHVIAGAIAGVGSIQRMKAVRWGLATTIVWAWVLTIPACGAGWRAVAAGSAAVHSKRLGCDRAFVANARSGFDCYFTGVSSRLLIIRSIMPYSSACSGDHDVVAIDVARHPVHRLTRRIRQNPVQRFAHAQNFFRIDVDIRRLSGQAAHGRLVDQNARVRKAVALALGPSGKQHGAHGSRLSHTIRDDVRLDQIHRVQNREARRNRPARRVDVQIDIFLRVLSRQEQHLRNDKVRDVIIHWRAEENNVLLQQAGVNSNARSPRDVCSTTIGTSMWFVVFLQINDIGPHGRRTFHSLRRSKRPFDAEARAIECDNQCKLFGAYSGLLVA